MLKGIPSIISPELLKILAEMGHGDEIVIGDGNFPGQSMNERCVRLDGHGVPEVMEAILQLMPLDTYAQPAYIIQKIPGDNVETPIWDVYKEIVAKEDKRGADAFCEVERFQFYENAKNAYAIIATGETALYANIMLQKGVV